MVVKEIHIDEFKDYVDGAFMGDEEILNYYDKAISPTTIQGAADNVVEKIRKIYFGSELRGIEINGVKVGYFVYADELLISFGMNKEYRSKEVLSEMWELIKIELGDVFQCLLYSYNERAINYLKKCGMNIIFDSVTILRFDNNLN